MKAIVALSIIVIWLGAFFIIDVYQRIETIREVSLHWEKKYHIQLVIEQQLHKEIRQLEEIVEKAVEAEGDCLHKLRAANLSD